MSALDEDDSRSSGPVLADSLDLTLDPMPTGATLLAPGEPAPKDNAQASAYGCYLASRPYSDEVAFHSKYLHFPESVVEEAGPATRQVAWSREAGLESNASTDAVGVRYMNCVIPDTDEAEQLAREQILEAGFEDAAYEAVQANEASSKTTCDMITVVEVTCAGPSDGPLETCTFEENTYLFCHGGGGSGSGPGDFPDPGDGPGGGDPGDGDPGEGNECTIDNPDPGSDCEPLDPCDGSNPPEACDDDEDEDVTPCEDVDFEDGDLQEIMEALEEEIMSDAWEDSNPDVDDQGDRQEQFYFVTEEEDGEYSYEAPSNITYYPTSVSGVSSADIPENVVGTFHTHPFEVDEVYTSEDIIERRVPEEFVEEKGMENIIDPSSAPNAFYPGGPSEADYLNSAEMGEELYHIVIDNDKVYEYQYDGEVSDDEPELDDDKKSSTAYQRCGY